MSDLASPCPVMTGVRASRGGLAVLHWSWRILGDDLRDRRGLHWGLRDEMVDGLRALTFHGDETWIPASHWSRARSLPGLSLVPAPCPGSPRCSHATWILASHWSTGCLDSLTSCRGTCCTPCHCILRPSTLTDSPRSLPALSLVRTDHVTCFLASHWPQRNACCSDCNHWTWRMTLDDRVFHVSA